MIQVQFTLQAQSGAVTSELGSRSAQVDDAILSVLHALNASDIAQPGGERMLKDMVLSRINRILTTGKISAVYIDNIIVQ